MDAKPANYISVTAVEASTYTRETSLCPVQCEHNLFQPAEMVLSVVALEVENRLRLCS